MENMAIQMTPGIELSDERCFDKDGFEADREIKLYDFNILLSASLYSLLLGALFLSGELICNVDLIRLYVKKVWRCLCKRARRSRVLRRLRRVYKHMTRK